MMEIRWIWKKEDTLEKFLYGVIEMSWNHMIPIFSTMLLVSNDNAWYIIGIIIPILFQMEFIFDGDD